VHLAPASLNARERCRVLRHAPASNSLCIGPVAVSGAWPQLGPWARHNHTAEGLWGS
jgi:hypothetical protein